MKQKILISGGTGLVGMALTNLFELKGYEVAYLTRNIKKTKQKSFYWNYETSEIDIKAIEYADIIVNLAGENISNKKWTAKQKEKIISSRVLSTELIENSIKNVINKPKAFISASAIGYYGTFTSNKIFKENDNAGNDFLSNTVLKWEESINKIQKLGIPTAILRIGVVMSKNGGALPKIIRPIKYGIGSALGNGKQWIPWIAIEDLSEMFLFVLEKKLLNNYSNELIIYNAVSENEINNKELMKQIAKSLNKPFFFPSIPSFIFNLVFGEMATILLKGSRVSPQKIISEGFKFKYQNIKDIL